jgi:hypothetical protein
VLDVVITEAKQQALILLGGAFTFYLAVIFAFSIYYYVQFRFDPSAFSFAADIERARMNETISELDTKIGALHEMTLWLSRACEIVEATNVVPSGNNDVDLPEGGKLSLEVRSAAHYHAIYEGGNAKGEGKREIVRWNKTSTWHRYGSQDLLRELKTVQTKTSRTLNASEGRLLSIKEGSPLFWSFADFFYFSTIVQSTVGFGDILPNRTRVRKVVTFQILLGYAVLIVLVNFLVSLPSQ